MKNATRIDLFGPDLPNRERLARELGVTRSTVDMVTDEFQFIVKTCTRLGWVVDLDTDPLEGEGSDGKPPKVRNMFGHPNALVDARNRLLPSTDLSLVLGDRLGWTADTEMSVAWNFVSAFNEQVGEAVDSGRYLRTKVQDLGVEALAEEAFELAPDLLRQLGYPIVGTPASQHILGNRKRPDLICTLEDGSTLVVELKRYGVTFDAILQCAGYVDYLRDHDGHQQIRGLVLGDGIDEVEDSTGRSDIEAKPLRAFDLPAARAQRWVWWSTQPTAADRPECVVAVAADGTTPVAAWPSLGHEPPVEPGSLGAWPPEQGWCCPVPLDWPRDQDQWGAGNLAGVVQRRLQDEAEGLCVPAIDNS